MFRCSSNNRLFSLSSSIGRHPAQVNDVSWRLQYHMKVDKLPQKLRLGCEAAGLNLNCHFSIRADSWIKSTSLSTSFPSTLRWLHFCFFFSTFVLKICHVLGPKSTVAVLFLSERRILWRYQLYLHDGTAAGKEMTHQSASTRKCHFCLGWLLLFTFYLRFPSLQLFESHFIFRKSQNMEN